MTTWAEASALTWEQIGAHTWAELLDRFLRIEIAGVDYGVPRLDTLKINHIIEERSTASFELVDKENAYNFQYGQEVIIYDYDDHILFGGLITCPQRVSTAAPSWGWCIHYIDAVDYHALADRRVFLGAYEEATGGEIVQDILLILAEEGITEGRIDAGDDITNISFNRVMCTEALEKVSELCGFTWYITEEKKLYFVPRGTYKAAWNISTGSEFLHGSMKIIHGNPEYRNVQYIQGGQALTTTQTESFKGDGTERSFTLRYPPAKQPVITRNGNPQTIGIKGVNPSGFNFYWSKGDLVIAQETSDTVLQNTDVLIVEYTGTFRLIAKASQSAEITRQRLAQGFGSGKIESIAKDAAIQSQDAAISMARAKLLHYARIGDKVQYETLEHGLYSGVLQTIDYPEAGLNELELLITNVYLSSDQGILVYSVEGVNGPVEDSWEKIFCRLADETKRQSAEGLGEADVIQGLEEFSKVWYPTDHPNPFLSVDSSGTPADIDFPCLADADKLSYCVLYSGGTEFFRKPITSQIIAAAQIDTICLVLAAEANDVPISHVGLWGGDGCNSTAGTGIEMEKHEFVKTKNSLESLQFNFTDTYEA